MLISLATPPSSSNTSFCTLAMPAMSVASAMTSLAATTEAVTSVTSSATRVTATVSVALLVKTSDTVVASERLLPAFKAVTICAVTNSSPVLSASPAPSRRLSPTATILIKVALTFCAATFPKGLSVAGSKPSGNPKFVMTVSESEPALSIMVVMAETYLEDLLADKVMVTASPVAVSVPPSTTILVPILSVASKVY